MADPKRRHRRIQSPALSRIRGILREDLAEGHTRGLAGLVVQLLQVRPHEPTHEGRRHVVRVPLDHQREVQQPLGREAQPPQLVSEEDAGDDGRA